MEFFDKDVLGTSRGTTKSLTKKHRNFVDGAFKTEILVEDFLEGEGCDCFTCVAEGVFRESPVGGEGCIVRETGTHVVVGTVVVLRISVGRSIYNMYYV